MCFLFNKNKTLGVFKKIRMPKLLRKLVKIVTDDDPTIEFFMVVLIISVFLFLAMALLENGRPLH